MGAGDYMSAETSANSGRIVEGMFHVVTLAS